jgi:hypothetical protein
MIFSGQWIMLSVFKYPGIYIEKLPIAVHRVVGVATLIRAFFGLGTAGACRQGLFHSAALGTPITTI